MIRFLNGVPQTLYLSAHDGGSAYTFDVVPQQDGRPITYIAIGSHANYATSGEHQHDLPGLYDYTDAGTAFPMEIMIGILVSIPFAVTIFLGGLSSIPQDIYEAASIDGAGPGAQFRTLTLPLMRPYLNIVLVLNVIYVFNSFPIIWVLTEGGPANSTDILITYLYKLAFVFGRMGDAAAVSLIMFAILIVFTLLYLKLVPDRVHGD